MKVPETLPGLGVRQGTSPSLSEQGIPATFLAVKSRKIGNFKLETINFIPILGKKFKILVFSSPPLPTSLLCKSSIPIHRQRWRLQGFCYKKTANIKTQYGFFLFGYQVNYANYIYAVNCHNSKQNILHILNNIQ